MVLPMISPCSRSHPNTLNHSRDGLRFIALLENRIPELQYFARNQGNSYRKAKRYQAAIAAIVKTIHHYKRGKAPCPCAMKVINRIYPELQIQLGWQTLKTEAELRPLARLDSQERVQCGGVRVLVHFHPGERRHANSPTLQYAYGKAIGHSSRHGQPMYAYVGNDLASKKLFKIYKTNGDGLVLEEVAMVGFPSVISARKAFLSDNPALTFGGIQPCTLETL